MNYSFAFQGVAGAYSELSGRKFFGARSKGLACAEFEDVFRAVVIGKAKHGVLPIENSLTGSIHQNFDLMIKHRVWICGEVISRISHSLLCHPRSKLSDLRDVYSHPQALWQCQRFLKSHRNLKPVPYFDTAGAAKYIQESGDSTSGAIASPLAAHYYGLRTLKEGIEDNPTNHTRFVVLTKNEVRPKGKKCKTSVAFVLKSVPGALHSALGTFAERGLQLFKVESRPIPETPWEYRFYLDFEGSFHARSSEEALLALKKFAKSVRILGSYAAATA